MRTIATGLSARISVVVPMYNAASTLERALQSVAEQTLLPFEVLCVDDGSQDHCAEVARRFDTRGTFSLQVLTQPRNLGAAAARNAGLARACGDYVAFLDADDSWLPNKLALQTTALLEHKLDLLGGHSAAAGAATLACRMSSGLTIQRIGLMRAMLSNPFHTSSVIVRNDPRVRFPDDGRLSEDYALWLRLVSQDWRCARHTLALSLMHKPAFGASGLSARLADMQCGEALALREVGWPRHPAHLALAWPVSWTKYVLRLLRARLRRG